MNAIAGGLKHRVKSLVEKTFDVRISRAVPNQWSDAAVRNLRAWSSQDVVFDVGANDGRTILRIQDLLHRPRIFAFEPVSTTYRTLVERTRDLDHVRCFQMALGAKPGRETIYLNEIAAMNSFSPDWAPVTGTEEVAVSTVDAVAAEHGIAFIHFLKIDTEGYELQVLEGARQMLSASRIGIVQVEAGFDQMRAKGFATLEEIRRHLAPLGYYLYGIYNQCRTKAHPAVALGGYDAEVLVYCDALFIRADLQT
jgi:FkbM family methyltransferase